ncbi:MAG: hypothetical protein ACHQ7N_10515 [Candidatus Methylomirabilales bacterium]
MALVVDAHSDMLNDLLGQRSLGQTGALEKTWVPGMKEGGIDLRVAAIFSSPQYLPELGLRRALDQVAALLAERGYPSETIDLIMDGNFLRIFKQVLKS